MRKFIACLTLVLLTAAGAISAAEARPGHGWGGHHGRHLGWSRGHHYGWRHHGWHRHHGGR